MQMFGTFTTKVSSNLYMALVSESDNTAELGYVKRLEIYLHSLGP